MGYAAVLLGKFVVERVTKVGTTFLSLKKKGGNNLILFPQMKQHVRSNDNTKYKGTFVHTCTYFFKIDVTIFC
jgi:hypothetical protein